MEGPPPQRLVALPSWLLGQAAGHGDRLVSAALAADGVRKHHFRVLLALDEAGPISQAEIGRRLSIDRSDLHAVLNTLEADGLVRRVRDRDDRRRNLVELTPDGVDALVRLTARVDAAQEALLAPLTVAERGQLRELLTRLDEHHAP